MIEISNFIPRKPFYEKDFGGLLSYDRKCIYFMGIIDIFTDYGARKSTEHFFQKYISR